MSKRRRTNHDRKAPGAPPRGSGYAFGIVFVVVLTLLLLAWWWSGKPPGPVNFVPEQPGTNTTAASIQSKSTYQRLLGKWVRPDGGYVIEIRSADETGKLDAGYFNPDPIHVARAEASGQGSMIKVFIELRDVNYPGSTYTLAYDREADVLKGIYFQAATEQQYEVYFERLKP